MPEMTDPGEFSVDPASGLLQPARLVLSPNRDARPAGVVPQLLILHGISLPPGEFAGDAIIDFFCNRLEANMHPYFEEIHELRVSAHLLLRRDASLLQFVPFSERAWHAGESDFRGCGPCNDYSIGIELEGDDETAYDERQYAVLPALIRAIMAAYPAISVREIAAHADVAPGRKTDPGPAFDWFRLYDALQP